MALPKDGLRPGDIIIHHDTNWWTGALTTFEWDGSSQEDLAANHVDIYVGNGKIAKMDPPSSHYYPVTDLPVEKCSVLRLKPIVLADLSTVDPANDPKFAATLEATCDIHMGESYDWNQIGRSLWIGLLARVNPKAAQAEMAGQNSVDLKNGHPGYCSQWVEARVEEALYAAYGIPGELFDGTDLGDDEARPSDFQRSPMLTRVSEVG